MDDTLFTPTPESHHHKNDNAQSNENKNSPVEITTKYKKLGSAGIEGVLFQINLLTVFVLNAIRRKSDWRLSTENIEAGKFDDVIFETSGDTVLLQAKHRSKSGKKITIDDLFSTNSKRDEFSLPKYFFSYQNIKDRFKVRNVVICTNALLDVEEEMLNKSRKMGTENMLYFDGIDNICNTFQDDVVLKLQQHIKLYYDKNSECKNIGLDNISYETVKDFLNHLQFIDRYPSGSQLDEVIERTISHSRFANNICPVVARKFIHNRIMDWYRQKNGVYLNYTRSTAVFSELISNNYRETLEQHKVFFEDNSSFLPEGKKIVYIPVETDVLMYVLKVYRVVEREQVLFLNPDDDVDTHVQIIDSFPLPQYSHLVIIRNKKLGHRMQIYTKIKTILDTCINKRVILIDEKDDKVAKFLTSPENNSCETIRCNLNFTDLSGDTRKRCLEKTILFQGEHVTLNELLAEASRDDLNRILNPDIMSQLLRNQKIEVGVPVNVLSESLQSYYIPRNFHRGHEYFTEEEICSLKERIVLISDSAGMGKSTVLTNLAHAIKKSHPSRWVFFVDLNSCTKYLRSVESKFADSPNMLDFLAYQDGLAVKSSFEENLLHLQGKFTVLLDGVDEISPHFTSLVLALISQCRRQANFERIFITTRPHLRERIEDILKVEAFALKSFSKRNQINFLRKYWKNELCVRGKTAKKKCKIYARALVTNMAKWIKNRTRNIFAENPLQTRMLAEMFQERCLPGDADEPENWESCKQYLQSKYCKTPRLPTTINLVELYQMFIQKKRDIFVLSKGNPTGNVFADEAVAQKYKDCFSRHYALALAEVFDKDERELFSCYRPGSDPMKDNDLFMVGLVQKLGNQVRFVHRSFAEYLVAECLLNELKRTPSQQFQYFFMDKLLNFGEFTVVRAFLDNMLQMEMEFIPRSTFKAFHDINYNTLQNHSVRLDSGVRVCLISSGKGSTFMHMLSREGRANILRFFFKSFDLTVKSPFARFFKMKYKRIDIDLRNYAGETALHLATMGGHAEVVGLLVERGADVNKKINSISPLRMALTNRFYDVVRVLLRSGADINSKSITDSSPLLSAAFQNKLDLVRLMLEEGVNVNVNIRNHLGLTPLLLAARRSNLAMLELLIQYGADVNAQDYRLPPVDYQNWIYNSEERNFTALHVASQRNNLAMAKVLVENGADGSIRSSAGRTCLHVAVRAKNNELAGFLARRCGNVNIQDQCGRTALHQAVLSENMDVYGLLRNLGGRDDIKDNFGLTPVDELGKLENSKIHVDTDKN